MGVNNLPRVATRSSARPKIELATSSKSDALPLRHHANHRI